MKVISLTKGAFALVDDQDYDWLNGYKWYLASNGEAGRSVWNGKNKRRSISMQRLIMGEPKGMDVDHINGDRLDNQRQNLRICTHRQNLYNSKLSKRNKSGYKGVVWDSKNLKWRASISLNGKTQQLGRFENIQKAALAYREAALRYCGEFARF